VRFDLPSFIAKKFLMSLTRYKLNNRQEHRAAGTQPREDEPNPALRHTGARVSTGTGEAALIALQAVGASGIVIGADIAAMLVGTRDQLKDPLFRPMATDGQALPFKSGSFDAVICQLGLHFLRTPHADRRVLSRAQAWLRSTVRDFHPPTGRRRGGWLPMVLSRLVPEQRDLLYLSRGGALHDRRLARKLL
jgi:hypothetical protein